MVGYLPVDKKVTLDKGATIGQSIEKNENAYRTSNDMVSFFNSAHSNMHTLANHSRPVHTGNPILDFGFNAWNAHNVNNIKDKSIFV